MSSAGEQETATATLLACERREGAGPPARAYLTFTCLSLPAGLYPPSPSSALGALRILRGEGLIKGSNKIIILNRMKYLYLPQKKIHSNPSGLGAGWGIAPVHAHSRSWREMSDLNLIPGESSPPPHPLWVERNACEIYLQKFRPQHGGGAQFHLPPASSTLIFFFFFLKKKKGR